MSETITQFWNAAKFTRFKTELARVKKLPDTNDRTVVEFEGGKYLFGYAGYLCQYLATLDLPPGDNVVPLSTPAPAKKAAPKPKRKVARRR